MSKNGIAIASVVVSLGSMLACSDAIAATALSRTTNASVAQYGSPQPVVEVLSSGSSGSPQQSGTAGASEVGGSAGAPQASGTAGASEAASSPGAANVTPTATPDAVKSKVQLASGDHPKLPFTGYAVIPMLLLGMALLIGGYIGRAGAGRRRGDRVTPPAAGP
jgi:hypothetical protein